MDLYDLHSHFLPGIDDGCRDEEESLALLGECLKHGVRGMMATPHYYSRESISDFLDRRQVSIRKLEETAARNKQPLPELCFGAEVAYRNGISRDPELRRLCLGNSAYLLLEMPFSKWDREVLRDVRQICVVRGLTPVIAHLERYAHFQTGDILDELYDSDILVQMNVEYYLDFWSHQKARKQIRSQRVHVMGSDCHGISHRPPNLWQIVPKMKKDGMQDWLYEIMSTNRMIFEEAKDKS